MGTKMLLNGVTILMFLLTNHKKFIYIENVINVLITWQAAYLVGIADPASEPGRPGLVDQSQFSRANQAIQMACQNLTNPASSQQQVCIITMATVLL